MGSFTSSIFSIFNESCGCPRPTVSTEFSSIKLTSEKRILLPSQPTSKVSRKRKREEKKVDVIGPSDSNVKGMSKKNLKRAKLSPIPEPSSSPNPPAEKPSAGSLETLVTQAITTKDERLFEQILEPKKVEVIRNRDAAQSERC